MSGADYFKAVGNNPYSRLDNQPSIERAQVDFSNVKAAVEAAGVKVVHVPPPPDCPDGVYTANWALCRNNTAVLSYLPNVRRDEMPYAEKVLNDLGMRTVKAPLRFSGQGDALPCGNYLFIGSKYRTDPQMHEFLALELGYEVISLEAIPTLDSAGQAIINKVTGWPDSFFYDLDLAISVLTPDLIAWCPRAFTAESQAKIQALPINKIEVSPQEATEAFACNLLSTGEVVIMSGLAPELKANIEAQGLKVVTPEVQELGKGGGYIRCTALTLDNE